MTDSTIEFQLNQLIGSLETRDFPTFKEKLLDSTKNVVVREYEGSGLALIANGYTKDIQSLNELEKECRSVIIDKEDLSIVCYAYDNIYYNEDAKNFLLAHNDPNRFNVQIQECLEGTMISVFFSERDGRWYASTRKSLDASNSKWNSERSYLDLFEEGLGQKFDEFCQKLKPEYCYFFILVHYENQNIIDYTEQFGEKYALVYHVLTRHQNTMEELELDDPVQFTQPVQNLRYPDLHEDFSLLDQANSTEEIVLPLHMEGMVVRVFDKESRKSTMLKLQTNSYQMMSVLKPNNNNIYKSFIELYQNEMLRKHLEYFTENSKITNPRFEEMPYDTIGVIDATFKVMTSELYELFKKVWHIKDCSHNDTELYEILPSEYKTILFKIRGIYYKKKADHINNRNKQDQDYTTGSNPKAKKDKLCIFDIYNLLKSYDTDELLRLLKARKNMTKEVIRTQRTNVPEKEVYQRFRSISDRCDRISLKMIAILLNKMYPDESQAYYNNMVEV